MPIEIALELEPRRRVDVFDVRAEVLRRHGPVLDPYRRCLYASHHTTAGYLPQSLAARLCSRPDAFESYLKLLSTIFPERAGYRHDQIELRQDVPPDLRALEPINADSHLAFIAGGLHSCVSYDARREMPVYIERTILDLPKILINGGRRGYLVGIAPQVCVDLLGATPVECALAE